MILIGTPCSAVYATRGVELFFNWNRLFPSAVYPGPTGAAGGVDFRAESASVNDSTAHGRSGFDPSLGFLRCDITREYWDASGVKSSWQQSVVANRYGGRPVESPSGGSGSEQYWYWYWVGSAADEGLYRFQVTAAYAASVFTVTWRPQDQSLLGPRGVDRYVFSQPWNFSDYLVTARNAVNDYAMENVPVNTVRPLFFDLSGNLVTQDPPWLPLKSESFATFVANLLPHYNPTSFRRSTASWADLRSIRTDRNRFISLVGHGYLERDPSFSGSRTTSGTCGVYVNREFPCDIGPTNGGFEWSATQILAGAP